MSADPVSRWQPFARAVCGEVYDSYGGVVRRKGRGNHEASTRNRGVRGNDGSGIRTADRPRNPRSVQVQLDSIEASHDGQPS